MLPPRKSDPLRWFPLSDKLKGISITAAKDILFPFQFEVPGDVAAKPVFDTMVVRLSGRQVRLIPTEGGAFTAFFGSTPTGIRFSGCWRLARGTAWCTGRSAAWISAPPWGGGGRGFESRRPDLTGFRTVWRVRQRAFSSPVQDVRRRIGGSKIRFRGRFVFRASVNRVRFPGFFGNSKTLNQARTPVASTVANLRRLFGQGQFVAGGHFRIAGRIYDRTLQDCMQESVRPRGKFAPPLGLGDPLVPLQIGDVGQLTMFTRTAGG
jgi:hypothetical protein